MAFVRVLRNTQAWPHFWPPSATLAAEWLCSDKVSPPFEGLSFFVFKGHNRAKMLKAA